MATIKCKKCGAVLTSKFVHDFQQCGCSNETFIDGGNEYTRIGGVDLNLIEFIDQETVESTWKIHYNTTSLNCKFKFNDNKCAITNSSCTKKLCPLTTRE